MLFLVNGLTLHAQAFYFGADLSYVNEMEDCGAAFNENGTAVDPFQLFAQRGSNLVRLRLWHTPSWYDELNAGIRYSDFADVRTSIIRAKAEGMHVLLDFHLSDNWADPSKQVAPHAWDAVLDNLPVLQDSLYNYIFSTLDKLATENLLPELVQIGNETNRGILLSQAVNDAGWTLDWDRNSALFNSAISAVRDIEELYQTGVKAAIHIADPTSVSWYIQQFVEYDVTDFDIIGMSYYWQWHDDTFEEVGNVITSLRNSYPGKEVMIFETAYPWTSSNADAANNLLTETYPGYSPFSPINQKKWMIDLTQEVIDNGGAGVIYWEPAWVSTGCFTQWVKGSSWDNATFFNAEHSVIENGAIQWMSHDYDFTSGVLESTTNENPYKISISGDKIRIERNNNLIYNEGVQVEIYLIDGRCVDSRIIDPVWEDNICYVSLPLLPANYYVFMFRFEGGVVTEGFYLR